MAELKLDLAEFRTALAGKIGESSCKHVEKCRKVLLRIDLLHRYEGPEIMNCNPHVVDMWDEFVMDGEWETFDEWYPDGGWMLRDWMMNLHPGLCPDAVSDAIEEALGNS